MEMCYHPLNHHITCRHRNGCSLSKLFFQVNVVTFLILGAIYLPLAQIKCFCSEERGRKQKERRKAFVVDLPGISRINYSLTAVF